MSSPFRTPARTPSEASARDAKWMRSLQASRDPSPRARPPSIASLMNFATNFASLFVTQSEQVKRYLAPAGPVSKNRFTEASSNMAYENPSAVLKAYTTVGDSCGPSTIQKSPPLRVSTEKEGTGSPGRRVFARARPTRPRSATISEAPAIALIALIALTGLKKGFLQSTPRPGYKIRTEKLIFCDSCQLTARKRSRGCVGASSKNLEKKV